MTLNELAAAILVGTTGTCVWSMLKDRKSLAIIQVLLGAGCALGVPALR
ncbi:hypothetical protein LJR175_008190 [Variovorax sp. LjRoot175]